MPDAQKTQIVSKAAQSSPKRFKRVSFREQVKHAVAKSQRLLEAISQTFS
jgi:hypothetical protein